MPRRWRRRGGRHVCELSLHLWRSGGRRDGGRRDGAPRGSSSPRAGSRLGSSPRSGSRRSGSRRSGSPRGGGPRCSDRRRDRHPLNVPDRFGGGSGRARLGWSGLVLLGSSPCAPVDLRCVVRLKTRLRIRWRPELVSVRIEEPVQRVDRLGLLGFRRRLVLLGVDHDPFGRTDLLCVPTPEDRTHSSPEAPVGRRAVSHSSTVAARRTVHRPHGADRTSRGGLSRAKARHAGPTARRTFGGAPSQTFASIYRSAIFIASRRWSAACLDRSARTVLTADRSCSGSTRRGARTGRRCHVTDVERGPSG